MLSGETTPLLKESIELWEADARLDVDGAHKNTVLFGDTKDLQSSPGEHRPQYRQLLLFYDVFIVLIYIIYIYIQLYFIFSLVCPYATASKAEPAHRSARALREGGSAHRSAHAPRQASLRPP